VPLANRSDHRNRLQFEPARNERQHPEARTIEPVRVIDDQQERLGAGRIGEELMCREGDEYGSGSTSSARPNAAASACR